jgi:nucleoside-diphosphate-sugar epimerase
LVLNMDGTEQRGCRRREPTPLRSIGRVIQPMASLFKIRTNHIDMANLPIGEPVQSVDAVSGAFLMIRRELFECLEGMDQDYFLHWEDFDLCRRCRDVGKAVLFSADAVVIHHKSASGGVSSHQVESLKNHSMLRYFRKFYPASCRFGLIQTLWLAALLRRYAIKLSTQLRRRPDSGVASLSNSFSYPKLRSDSVVVVTGASSQIGDFLLPQLQQLPDTIIAISRGSRAGMVEGNVWWVEPDLVEHLAKIISCKQLTWYHLAPVWIADQFSRKLVKAGLSRVVGVSSSSVLTKSNSGDSIETGIVAKLLDGENHLMCLAEKSSINVTLFRPSMVYGNNNNKNIATIKKLIRYFRCYPLVGVAAGKRQPINAHDIADSCLKVHSCAAAFGKIYILAGGEVLTYRQMIERVFQSMGIKPRFLILPTGLLRMLLKVFSSLPGGGFLSPEMADRMQKDLLFDIKTAKQDFDFCPSDFRLK